VIDVNENERTTVPADDTRLFCFDHEIYDDVTLLNREKTSVDVARFSLDVMSIFSFRPLFAVVR